MHAHFQRQRTTESVKQTSKGRQSLNKLSDDRPCVLSRRVVSSRALAPALLSFPACVAEPLSSFSRGRQTASGCRSDARRE